MAYTVNQSVIDKAKKDYEAAKAAGDTAGMAAAHAAAEAERAKAGYSGGADGSQKIPTNSGPSTYKPLGTYNDAGLSDSDQAKVDSYKAQYESAKAAGNTAGMEAAHAAAEAIRQQYNYSGGGDGSDYIPFPVEEELELPTFDFDTQSRPTFNSKYGSDVDELLNQILTREDFSYNVEDDPLYQQYKQAYLREGSRAMNDTLASAAANAGGMNSYAVTAAQQANNYYNSELNDRIPELYQLAYEMYLDDIDGQVRDLGLLQSMDDTQYNRYRDTMGDWENDRDFAYNKYVNDRDFAYGVSRDEVSDSRHDQEWEYNTGLNDKSVAYEQAMDFLNLGIMPSDELLATAGISLTEAYAYLTAKGFGTGIVPSGNSGSGSGSGSGSSKGTSSSSSGSNSKKTNSNTDNVVKSGIETDGYYSVSTETRKMYDKGASLDDIAEYIAKKVEDGTISSVEAKRISEKRGLSNI